MSSVVCCGNLKGISVNVEIPDGVTIQKGEAAPCPQGCRYKSYCKGAKSFVVKQVLTEEEAASKYIFHYNAEEIRQHFSVAQNSSSSSDDSNSASFTATKERNDEETEHIVDDTVATVAQSSVPSWKDYFKNADSFAPSRSAADTRLAPKQQYKKIVLGGPLFSDDPEIKAKYHAFPLRNALWQILTHWKTGAVFTSDGASELKDEFVWLITKLSERKIMTSEVTSILENEQYNRSQKFFYLFYDVIFKYELRKFYWYDGKDGFNAVIERFGDKEDFAVRYCDMTGVGESFRKFFAQHKKEVLHYFNCDSEDDLFGSMTLLMSKKCKQIVMIDSFNGYIPVYLGTVKEYFGRMLAPNDCETTKMMLTFLEKYNISSKGDVSRRLPATPFLHIRNDQNFEEDQSMYEAAGIIHSASCFTIYDGFVSMLHEYTKVFNPSEIRVGELLFTKKNYSAELKKIIFDFCKAHFGNAPEETYREAKGKAWLAKSLYERNVLTDFVCENKKEVDKFMALITKEKMTLANYYRAFPIPVIVWDGNDRTIPEYIEIKMQSEDAYGVVNALLGDERVTEYLSVHEQKDAESLLRQNFEAYQSQFDKFLKNNEE